MGDSESVRSAVSSRYKRIAHEAEREVASNRSIEEIEMVSPKSPSHGHPHTPGN